MKTTFYIFERMYHLAITFTLVAFLGCGSGSNSADNEMPGQSATLTFQFKFSNTSNHAFKTPVSHAIGEPNICNDYLVDKIEVQVYLTLDDSEVAFAEADCAKHSLDVSNVPAAVSLYLVCKGYVGDSPVWQGRVEDIVAVAGQNNDIGVVHMNYSGDDGAAPEVVSTFPAPDAANVDLNAAIVVVFNEKLAPGTLWDQAITVLHDDIPVSGNVDYDKTFTAIYFIPADPYDPETTYTATLHSKDDGSGKITDTAGNLFSGDASWVFSTRGLEDNAPPQVIMTSPVNGATDVAPNASVSAMFSEPMDPVSLSDGVFQLSSDQGTVSCQIEYDDQTQILSMTPDSDLNAATIYTAVISDQGKDLAQNALLEPYAWELLTVGYIISTSITPQSGGTISPVNGTVLPGDDITINIGVNPYYHLSELIVDGVPVTPASSYLFENVSGNHKIEAVIKSNEKNISEQWPIRHYSPKIDPNGNVVWYGCASSRSDCDIYYYDGKTTKNITEEKEWSGAIENLQINANGDVVWSGRKGANSDYAIYYYDRHTEFIIPISETADDNPDRMPGDYKSPQINNDGDVVWSGHGFDMYESAIYYYDRSTAAASIISETDYSGANNNYSPQINVNGDVVWYGYDYNDEVWDSAIYYYDRSTSAVTMISEGPNGSPNGDDIDPQINADGLVVWKGRTNQTDPYDIYYYDRDRETGPVTNISQNSNGDDLYPQINAEGDAVWHGNNGIKTDIFFYKSENATSLGTNISENLLGSHHQPAINANGEVVWSSAQGIYYYDGSAMNNICNIGGRPCQINDHGIVVWRKQNDESDVIYLSSP